MGSFYVPPEKIRDNRILIEGQEFRHAVQVMRLREGDRVRIIDGTGREYGARIESITGRTAFALIEEACTNTSESSFSLTLYQSMIKIPRFEFILEKATELGVTGIVPLLTSRSSVKCEHPGDERTKRWKKILQSAACQCGRVIIPELSSPSPFAHALACRKGDLAILCCPEASGSSLKALAQETGNIKGIDLFLGPEGGFSDHELNLARSQGIHVLSLGARILRSETAAVVSIALVLHEFECLQDHEK
jgi:16S rRNA (uracil1498-N3)-methyltransferase